MFNGSGNGARSGAQTLMLLAGPLSSPTLRALADGPRLQSELRREMESPAQTTLRSQLASLVRVGAIEKRRRNRFPGVLEYELTTAGRELLFVQGVLDRWHARAPGGPLSPGSNAAKAATRALAESWSATMLRALAARPLSLTELDGLIAGISYPSLERRLAALRLSGLVEARPGSGRGTPYAATRWLREGVAPLAAATRWERRHLPETSTAIGPLDAEAGFLLALPMLRLHAGLRGSCRLAAEIGRGRETRLAGVVVELADGEIESCSTRLDGTFDAWALGASRAWLDAVVKGGSSGLELGGDCGLARSLLDGLHEALFGTEQALVLDSDTAIEDDRSN